MSAIELRNRVLIEQKIDKLQISFVQLFHDVVRIEVVTAKATKFYRKLKI